MCGDPRPVRCSFLQGKMHCPLLIGALQHRMTEGLCHCIYTCEDLLFTQVCSDPRPVHCSTVQRKMHCPLLTGRQQAFVTAFTPRKICCSQRCAGTLQHCSGQNSFPTVRCCSARQAHSRHCVTAFTPVQMCSLCLALPPAHWCCAKKKERKVYAFQRS